MGNPISSALASIFMDQIDQAVTESKQLKIIFWKSECNNLTDTPKKIINSQDVIIPGLSFKLIKASVKSDNGEYIAEQYEKWVHTIGLRLARNVGAENKVPQVQINQDLPLSQQKELKRILLNLEDLFTSKLDRTNLVKHNIDTENVKPIKHKSSHKERNIIKEQIQDMLKEEVIRPSTSPWAFPVILVKKKMAVGDSVWTTES
ncbi:hypothetical protein LAZ67_X002124 [Cordylochernes scorpioides]|uniref:Reverse transcriptase n=1 Tax=Cordylochernes scorpioides TaxID=51811 RepID=A0ABY6LXC4_9ARAC|nr:hypothetical protein LAZ67_X002124 [Cordylochernes scorpioides]